MGSQSTEPPATKAWQPITPGGVAAFAAASLSRLIVFQAVFAALNGLVLAWLLSYAVYPTVRAAINQLPDAGEIRSGVLDWHGTSPVLLAEGRVLAVTVDLEHRGATRVPSDFLIEIGSRDLRMFSVAGFSQWNYPSQYIISANRADLVPWWGAWRAPLLGLSLLGLVCVLLAVWAIEASFLFGPAWILAFYANRSASLAEAWRLCGAAMMPASLVLLVGLLLYGTGATNLVGFLFFGGLAILTSVVYVVVATLRLPRDPVAAQSAGNPFSKSGK